MASTLLSIQILPRAEDEDALIALVDRAIAVIDRSGVAYRVGPLETTMEGELEELLAIVKRVNEEMTAHGSTSVISQIKILHKPAGTSMASLTAKYDG
jgi:uncharacterized protein YqgV (UPF0045/DUF77 family)